MNRIDQAFARAREEGRAALIVFITAGDPDLETSAALVPELAAAGADIVELGIPHSDPIAEGRTIQASSERALRHPTQLAQILALCRRLREVSEVPLVLMGYVNNVLAYGEETLVQSCATAGVDGLIVAEASSTASVSPASRANAARFPPTSRGSWRESGASAPLRWRSGSASRRRHRWPRSRGSRTG